MYLGKFPYPSAYEHFQFSFEDLSLTGGFVGVDI